MEPHALPSLAAWGSFYVIVGSSAAALTGLQFVVIVLGAEGPRVPEEPTTRAFATPTIVHFTAALLLSAMLSAPWPTLSSVALALAICGAAGVVYVVRVMRLMRGQTAYTPVLEDWIWHGVLPVTAYVGLLSGAIILPFRADDALFVIAATSLVLLFVGIHNAWDTATFLAHSRAQRQKRGHDRDRAKQG